METVLRIYMMLGYCDKKPILISLCFYYEIVFRTSVGSAGSY
jgi:hypothetical protein